MEIVSDRPLTIGSETFRAGLPFDVEDWRGTLLIQAGTARHARPPDVLYETFSREQDDAGPGERGVTCLCLTRNRRQWLPKAIACYLAQDYEARELLIIADGEDVRDLVPERGDIRLIHVAEGWRIGEKRNFGASRARGGIIAHWDDDDCSAPDRLSDQAQRLSESGKAVTGYQSMVFTDGEGWWRYQGAKDFALGTSLCYRKSWWEGHPFPSHQIGEDYEFVKMAQKHNQIVSVNSDRMVATIHPGNTSPRQVASREWEQLPGFTGFAIS